MHASKVQSKKCARKAIKLFTRQSELTEEISWLFHIDISSESLATTSSCTRWWASEAAAALDEVDGVGS